MAGDGGLIALTFLLLAALLVLLYCLVRQFGPTKQCLRRVCAIFFGASSFLPRTMAGGGGVSGMGEEDDDEADYTDSARGGQANRGQGLFWKTSDEERSILGCRRVPSTNLSNSAVGGAALTGNNFHKGGFDSTNSYHADYTYLQQVSGFCFSLLAKAGFSV